MATSKATLSDAEALTEAVEFAKSIWLRMERDSEAADAMIRWTLYWRIAAKNARRGRPDNGVLSLQRMDAAFSTFHQLDEDGRALCLDEDSDRPSMYGGDLCEGCSHVARQLAEWGEGV